LARRFSIFSRFPSVSCPADPGSPAAIEAENVKYLVTGVIMRFAVHAIVHVLVPVLVLFRVRTAFRSAEAG